MERLKRLKTSNTSARWIRTRSGLFDKGFAGDLKFNIFETSAKTFSDDILLTPTISDDSHDMMMGMDPGILSFLDPLGEASLDSFMDLSTFFNEGSKSVEPMDGATEIEALIDRVTPAATSSITAAPFLKLETEEVVTEAVDVVGMEEVVVTMATTPDHDYVCKKPRLSTSSIVSEDGAAAPVPAVKYRVRRDKNNVASRRSRETRKKKFSEMEVEATQLEVDNAQLIVRIDELEILAKEMKAILVAKLVGK